MATSQNPYTLRSILRNIGFYCGFLILNLFIFIISPFLYLILRTAKKHSQGQAVRRIIWIYGRMWVILTSLFVEIKIDTKKAADYPKPSIILVNHQSFFDAFCMGALPIYDIIFLVREWPFRIPFYGHYMRQAKYINSENMSCEEFVCEAKEKLNRGISIIIFPEGTRSKNGQLGRFYSGAFKLATESKHPIVPVCIDGSGKFLPKGKFLITANPISIRTLPTIDPNEFKKFGQRAHIELRKNVKKMFLKDLEQSFLHYDPILQVQTCSPRETQ
ncbi:1-acyl-sn-glycerol-3-phosphate acyltransferase [Desulfomicrobium norvegicum]|uniref:1-acyl-sn-glycerol-3-phosphate acyltransferase n=1 Tax=Desulfomicrobium norvegicum (strain DSM 1741 / NCIMB 8310) TaxID=52561 RepID=A0A8G2F4X1_DESNO|nr:lysophospholipid acyltransferase family protein [Desulfomicrobium norvegicum]SFL84754.1 1-acyl-sn-glycerol-3-phosphate acyltransferase [Desulfomicrobium norvegicum]